MADFRHLSSLFTLFMNANRSQQTIKNLGISPALEGFEATDFVFKRDNLIRFTVAGQVLCFCMLLKLSRVSNSSSVSGSP